MFSVRSSGLNPRSPQSPWRTWSPSSSMVCLDAAHSFCSNACAMVVLPAPDGPVNQSTLARWPFRASLCSLGIFHGSGCWFLGSHWPKLSLWMKKRYLARAFSSSRRPPPRAASTWCFFNVSSKVTACSVFRLASGPVSSFTRPLSILSCTEPIMSSA